MLLCWRIAIGWKKDFRVNLIPPPWRKYRTMLFLLLLHFGWSLKFLWQFESLNCWDLWYQTVVSATRKAWEACFTRNWMFMEELYESWGVDYVYVVHIVFVICRGLLIRGLAAGCCILRQKWLHLYANSQTKTCGKLPADKHTMCAEV